jgi:hypothetical protein
MRPSAFALVTIAVAALNAGAARAGSDKPSINADPISSSRTDKPDGSSALTFGRQLPTEWDTKIGTDVRLAAPEGTVVSDNLTRGGAPDQSSGAVWGNMTMPGFRPLGFDKTSVDARLDAGTDQGKLGATLSRSVPLNENLSVTLQNNYSLTQTLANTPRSPMPSAISNTFTPSLAAGESLRLNVHPSGTTVSAGAESSTTDTQWRSRLSVEQTLLGPLKLTTSVEDAGTAGSRKSITAGFKRVW